jgi:hypothetical protein
MLFDYDHAHVDEIIEDDDGQDDLDDDLHTDHVLPPVRPDPAPLPSQYASFCPEIDNITATAPKKVSYYLQKNA